MIRPQRRNAGCCIKASCEIDFRILPFLHSVLENIGRRYRHSDSADYGLVSISDRGQRVQQDLSDLKYNLRFLRLGAYALGALLALSPEISRADESGASFWLPGQVDSLPAVAGGGLLSHHRIGFRRRGRGKRDPDRQVLADR